MIEQTMFQQQAVLIMEYIQGIPLSRYEGQIDEERLLDWAKQLLDLLAHVHTCGILHLDLKPDNILLDDNQKLHLIDFGTAQYHRSQNRRMRYGTIGFSPKEQYQEYDLDERCDIYAFGKTLLALYFHMKDGNLLNTLNAENTSLSRKMKNLIQSCIQEEPALRISSVSEVQEQLARILRISDENRFHRMKLCVRKLIQT